MLWNLFNSNFFVALVTLIVGGLAIFLYFKQKNDRKREIAKLILQEIRYAEDIIKRFAEHKNYKLYDKLLPTNNWNSNINMFLSDFSETDIDSISEFYSKTSYIDVIIEKISNQKNDPKGIEEALKKIEEQKSSGNAGAITVQLVSPLSDQILKETSSSISKLYNTPISEKFMKIYTKKWYQLI